VILFCGDIFKKTNNISHHEQQSVVLHFIHTTDLDAEIREYFITHTVIDNTTKKVLCARQRLFLDADELEISDCRDSETNMQDAHQGVEANVHIKPQKPIVFI